MTVINLTNNNKDLFITAWIDSLEVEFVWESEFSRPLLHAVLKDNGLEQASVYWDDHFVGVFSAKTGWVY